MNEHDRLVLPSSILFLNILCFKTSLILFRLDYFQYLHVLKDTNHYVLEKNLALWYVNFLINLAQRTVSFSI